MVSLESYLGVRQGRIWGRGGPVPVWEEGRPVTASELEGWRGSMNRIDFREFPPQLLLFISDSASFRNLRRLKIIFRLF